MYYNGDYSELQSREAELIFKNRPSPDCMLQLACMK